MMDQLTQVYSYAYFHRRFTEEVERAQRLNECLSVLLLEVDNLKDYRETHGWQATERVLLDIAKLVGDSVRNIDVVGRYGVDEIIMGHLVFEKVPDERTYFVQPEVPARLDVEDHRLIVDPACHG
jgi:diguanylate cyclase (GGDEF)-like protein